jgi:lysozyme
MASLAYNIGLEAFAKSTVLKRHNAGDRQAAARAFALWNKARNPNTGQLEVLDGLTARRAREAALYLTPDLEQAPLPMPQAVAPESGLTASPIARTGATSVGAGALVGLTSFAEGAKGYLDTIKEMGAQAAEFIGVTPQQGLAMALLVAGAVVLYQRYKQRSQGWA